MENLEANIFNFENLEIGSNSVWGILDPFTQTQQFGSLSSQLLNTDNLDLQIYPLSYENLLESSQEQVRQLLTQFLTQSDSLSRLEENFGNSWNISTATTVIASIAKGQDFPSLQILPQEILSAQGAFSQQNNTIYLSQQLLETGNSQAIVSVLLEELGHYLDRQLNPNDTPGDEGRLFATVVQGIELTPLERQSLFHEDDRLFITLNGETLIIEQSLNDIIGTAGRDIITGTSGGDRLIGGAGADLITGGGGNDLFVYQNIRDAGDTIKDFEIGKDQLDLTLVLQSFGYTGFKPLADSYIKLNPYSAGTVVLLDSDGKGSLTARPYIYLETIQPSSLSALDFLPNPGKPPEITANLVNDTGVSSGDRLTFDPTITGQIIYSSPLVSLKAQLNGQPVEILPQLLADGKFTLTTSQLEQINGGSLPDGDYTLKLTAQDNKGNAAPVYDYNFILDRTAPVLSLDLAPDFDSAPLGDLKTTFETVTLVGVTEANLSVSLIRFSSLGIGNTTANNLGEFSFDNQSLLLGDNVFVVSATDLAGNQGQFSQTIERLIDVEPPTIVADIVNDTGISNSDRLTLDPTINGQITSDRPIISLEGSLNGGNFVDLTSALKGDGTFTLSVEEYDILSNGSLPDGNYTVILKATNDRSGQSVPVSVSFTLDRTPPLLNFDLAPESDTGVLGDKITSERQVTLIGTTEPNLEILLKETQIRVTADSQGNFTFTNITLPSAGQAPFTMVALDAAGNMEQVLHFLTREGINGAPEITSNPETVFDTNQQTSYTYQVVATDPDNDALTYTLLNAPQGAEIDENGLISFTPSGILQPYYQFAVEVSDGRGGTDTQVFTVEVPIENSPPVIISEPITRITKNLTQGESEVIDLSTWSKIQYELNSQPDANWILSSNNTGIEQIVNADASILLSDFNLNSDRIEGSWRVNTSGDDDLMGFVFGYQDSQHFYLFDWKQSNQPDGLGFAEQGMSIKVVNADSPLTGQDFWPTIGNGDRVKTIFHNTIPWSDFVDYQFSLDFTPGEFTITVSQGQTILESVTIKNDTYTSGKFGFYNYSQGNVIYQGFTQAEIFSGEYFYDVEATDADEDNLTYSLQKSPEGMTINPQTGEITWKVTTTEVSSYPVTVLVEDGKGGFDTQEFVVELVEGNPQVDLTISNIDAENLVIDGQLLTVSGQVSAQISNQGLDTLNDPFKVSFFEDRNINQAYDQGIDTILGSVAVNTPLAAGQTTTVTTNLSGLLSSANNIIWGFVDSEKVIAETDETNNLTFNGAAEIRGTKWLDSNGNGQIDQKQGRIIVSHDVNTFATARAGQQEILFATNVANWLIGDNKGSILAIQSNADGERNYDPKVLDGLTNAGFDVTVSQTNNFTLNDLKAFDAVFVGQIYSTSSALNNQVLIDYLNSGGNVYIYGGVGPSPSQEAANWDLFLNTFGFDFANSYNGIYSVPINSSHPIFNGINQLASGNGQSIFDLELDNSNNLIIQSFSGQGVYAAYSNEQSIGEPGLAGITVYLDLNNNGILDANEPTRITASDNPNTPDTDETGQYRFTNLSPGTYIVREVVPEGYKQTFPILSGTTTTKTINFDSFVGMANIPIVISNSAAAIVPAYAQLSDQFLLSDGVIFSSESPYIGVVDITTGLPPGHTSSPFNGIGGVTNDGKLSYSSPIIGKFFLPSNPSVKAVTNFISVETDTWGTGIGPVMLEVFDLRGNLIGSMSAPDIDGPTLSLSVEGIHSFRITGNGTSGFDDLTFGPLSSFDFYTIQLEAGEIVENIDFANQRLNRVPVITSQPVIAAVANVPYRYELKARDLDGDPLTYTLIDAPNGMTIDENGVITWNPSAFGSYDVAVEVNDGQGGVASQNYTLTVGADTEAPKVNLGFNGTVINIGGTLNLQVAATDNVGVQDIDLSFNGTPLTLNPDLPNQVNTTSITLNQLGVFEVLATAKDTSGNIGTKTLQVRVIDPNDQDAPGIVLDLSKFDPLKPVTEITNIIGTISDDLESWRVEIAPVSLIDLNNPAANDSDYITIATGTGNVDNDVLAQIDPRLYRNDSYYVRVVAQDYSGNINVQGTVLGLYSETKPGEFRLEYTDLSVPLTGIPIQVNRVYSSLDAQFQGDFGYGWNLGLQDAQIQEASRDGRDLSGGNFDFGGNAFTVGTRVTLTTPDGRRVGFTFNPTPVGGSLFGVIYKPTFTPDAGVYDTLEVDYSPLSVRRDGSVGLYLFSFLGFNPSEYRLTTKEGTVYRYDQYEGLIDITDRNGNKLTYTDAGIFSSTGQSITFNRDAQGRITEIIDPDGQAIKYSYDAKGDLIGVSDRTNYTTEFEYENPRPHYLTEVIDPLGRSATRTEYDEQGRMKRLIDAEGNALDLTYTQGTSSQTVKDSLGNTITRIFDARGNVVQEIDALGGITQRTYDANNKLLSETDPLGNTTSYTYDSQGNVLTKTDPLGRVTRYTFNNYGKVLTRIKPNGEVINYTYDDRGNLLSLTALGEEPMTLSYDSKGQLITLNNGAGIKTFAYDDYGNLIRETNALGHVTTYTYDGNGQILSETKTLTTTEGVRTIVTQMEYDAQGRLIRTIDAEGGISQTLYDKVGHPIEEIDALGRSIKYIYNERGLLIETIYPDSTPNYDSDNPRTRTEYDVLDRVIAEIDEQGNYTLYKYDKLGRKIETIYSDNTPDDDSDNPRTRSEYDAAGRVIAEIDERGNRKNYVYDKAGQLIEIVLPDDTPSDLSDNPHIFRTYDAAGRQTSEIDPLGQITRYSYDNFGRPTVTELADGTTITLSYDSVGRLTSQTDQAGNTIHYEYDPLGRLTTVIDVLGQKTEYGYNELGKLVGQKDANGHITLHDYDGLGRRILTQLPLGQQSSTIYDSVGNLLSMTNFNGQTITYEYDARNRLIAKHFPDGTSDYFTYTLNGLQQSVTDIRGVTTYKYDVRDRLIERIDPDGRSISYTYDVAGNRTRVTIPSGTTTYTFDAQNRLKTVTAPNGGITNYTYDLAGNLIQTELPNGTVENRQYDALNRLVFLQNSGANGVIDSFRYTLDPVGNRLAIEEQDGRRIEYTYDKLYRLLSETILKPGEAAHTITYTYDPVSNRLTRNDSAEGITNYSYDANDRLLTATNNGIVTTYTYDANGNTLSKTTGSEEVTYQWDVQNRLISADTNGDGITDVVNQYDTNGIRVSQTVNGQKTHFLIDTNLTFAQVLEEYTSNGGIEVSYIYGLDLISQTRQMATSFYHVDGLGSTRALTDEMGLLTDRYLYDSGGRLIEQTGSTENSYLFAGEQRDLNIGLDYLRARYLDVDLGRLYGRDPFEGIFAQPITLNKYLYANANPVMYVDPSGNISIAQYVGITAVVVAAVFGAIDANQLYKDSQSFTGIGGRRIRGPYTIYSGTAKTGLADDYGFQHYAVVSRKKGAMRAQVWEYGPANFSRDALTIVYTLGIASIPGTLYRNGDYLGWGKVKSEFNLQPEVGLTGLQHLMWKAQLNFIPHGYWSLRYTCNTWAAQAIDRARHWDRLAIEWAEQVDNTSLL